MKPEHPHDAGIPEEHADRSHMEGARILADQARSELSALGFTAQEIGEWSETYLAEEGSGDVDSFLAWIKQREDAQPS